MEPRKPPFLFTYAGSSVWSPNQSRIKGEIMLQIIGWLLCVYLIVKACELLSMDTDEHRLARPVATIGAVIALLSAGGFFFMINEQAKATSTNPFTSPASTLSSDPNVNYETDLGSGNVEADADNAMKAADAALQNAQEAINHATR
jgi:hypothetical protein